MDVFNFFFLFVKPSYNDRDGTFSRALYCNGIWNKTTVYDKFEERRIVSVIKGYAGFMIRIKY